MRRIYTSMFVNVDIKRFRAACKLFGGVTPASRMVGASDSYISDRMRYGDGRLREEVANSIAEMAGIPLRVLMGDGTDEEFETLLRRCILKRSRAFPPKHRTCDSYCHGCIYECVAAATPLMPPERYCDYYYQTKQVRGCPAGQGCTRRHLREGAESRAKVNILISGSHIPFRR